MKITIRSIQRYQTDKTGNQLFDKDGKPYTKLIITADEIPDTKLYASFLYNGNPLLAAKIGDEVEVDVKVNGAYTNISLPRKKYASAPNPKIDEMATSMASLHEKMDAILERLEKIEVAVKAITPLPF